MAKSGQNFRSKIAFSFSVSFPRVVERKVSLWEAPSSCHTTIPFYPSKDGTGCGQSSAEWGQPLSFLLYACEHSSCNGSLDLEELVGDNDHPSALPSTIDGPMAHYEGVCQRDSAYVCIWLVSHPISMTISLFIVRDINMARDAHNNNPPPPYLDWQNDKSVGLTQNQKMGTWKCVQLLKGTQRINHNWQLPIWMVTVETLTMPGRRPAMRWSVAATAHSSQSPSFKHRVDQGDAFKLLALRRLQGPNQ